MFDRLRRGKGGVRPGGRDAGTSRSGVDEEHLQSWSAGRRGVEGFVEPPTAVSGITLLLVAHDGEWTRRRVPDARWAHAYCNRLSIPSYDAAVVGVPQRMRDYNHRVSAEQKRRAREQLGDL